MGQGGWAICSSRAVRTPRAAQVGAASPRSSVNRAYTHFMCNCSSLLPSGGGPSNCMSVPDACYCRMCIVAAGRRAAASRVRCAPCPACKTHAAGLAACQQRHQAQSQRTDCSISSGRPGRVPACRSWRIEQQQSSGRADADPCWPLRQRRACIGASAAAGSDRRVRQCWHGHFNTTQRQQSVARGCCC